MTARLSAALARHGYISAVVAIALSTAVFLAGRDWFAKGPWALLYLLIILLVASAAGTGPAVVAAVLAFFTWNFFFLPPYHTLQVHDPQDWIALVAFLVVGVIVGIQAGRMREREARAVAREQETAALNRLSATVVSQTSTGQMAQSCLGETVALLGADAATLVVREDGGSHAYSAGADGADASLQERARAMMEHKTAAPPATSEPIGAPTAVESGTTRPPGAAQPTSDLFVLVPSPLGVAGVLAVRERANKHPYSETDGRLVASLANLVGAFLERERLQTAATTAAAEREADHLKSKLLSSVSHELKTPLAALTATVSNLLEGDVDWDEQSVRDELRAIVGDVARLNNSIGSLLDLSRLEAHAWQPRRELYELGDIIAAGIDTLPAHLRQRVAVDFPDESPVVNVDFAQWARVIQTLLENALLYSGADSPITIGVRGWNDGARLWVEDEGPGIPAEEHEAVFEKFYRGAGIAGSAPSGTGLGLAIAREIVRGHGGTIGVEDVVPHGARIVIALPLDDQADRKDTP